jgi:hypothetical protein
MAGGRAGQFRQQEQHPAVGSTVTYLQRYTLFAATGMAVQEQRTTTAAAVRKSARWTSA